MVWGYSFKLASLSTLKFSKIVRKIRAPEAHEPDFVSLAPEWHLERRQFCNKHLSLNLSTPSLPDISENIFISEIFWHPLDWPAGRRVPWSVRHAFVIACGSWRCIKGYLGVKNLLTPLNMTSGLRSLDATPLVESINRKSFWLFWQTKMLLAF